MCRLTYLGHDGLPRLSPPGGPRPVPVRGAAVRRELLADQAGAVGYLLKDRVFNDDRFADAIRTVAAGGTVMDPEVVAKLMGRRARDEPITRLTAREREVLKLMAEGRSNSAIAQRLFISEKAVGKHSTSIFTKLDLAPSTDDNRRVLAVLAFLNS